jgi:hypothetical protein
MKSIEVYNVQSIVMEEFLNYFHVNMWIEMILTIKNYFFDVFEFSSPHFKFDHLLRSRTQNID